MTRAALLAAAAAVALAVPWLVPGGYALHLAIMAAIYTSLALSLNLLLGYAGQLSLGHVAYFGLGAYTAALLDLEARTPMWAGLAAGGALAGLAGAAIGALAFKLRGAYFVILTVSFAEVIRLVALNWMDLTQGPLGLPGITPFASKTSTWFAALALAAVCLLVCHRIVRARAGRALVALRENEPLARSVGIDVYLCLVVASGLSAAMAGLAGGIYAHHQAFMSPEVFSFGYTVTMIIMVVAGGQGTLAGPVLGAVLFTLLPEWLRAAQEWRLVVYAVILLAVVIFMPKGIVPAASAWLRRRRPRLAAQRPSASEAASGAPPREAGGSALPAKAREGGESTTAPLLEATGVDVRFGGVQALSRVDLVVGEGEIAALIGPNGAGKTTLFNVVSGFVRPDAGRVTFAGRDLVRLSPHEVAAAGLVRTFQKTSVFAGISTCDNVRTALHLEGRAGMLATLLGLPAIGREERRIAARAAEILEVVGLGRRTADPAGALAYGEQRLLEIAIALGASPRLLLLDEPAAGMNPTETAALGALIGRIRDRGVTVLLVEHDIRLVMRVSDRVTVLDHGKVICCDAPEAVQRNQAVIGAYLGMPPAAGGRAHAGP